GPRVGFRQCKTASQFARCKTRQESLLLFFCSKARQNVAHDGMSSDRPGKAKPSTRQLFENGCVRDVVEIQAAVSFGNIRSEQTQLFHSLDQRMRILIAMLQFGRDRHNLALNEYSDGMNNLLLFIAQL